MFQIQQEMEMTWRKDIIMMTYNCLTYCTQKISENLFLSNYTRIRENAINNPCITYRITFIFIYFWYHSDDVTIFLSVLKINETQFWIIRLKIKKYWYIIGNPYTVCRSTFIFILFICNMQRIMWVQKVHKNKTSCLWI